MNTNNLDPDDVKLSALLRKSRVAPPLPPRFQEGVWRRVEASRTGRPVDSPRWLDALLAWALRPRFAFAAVAAMVVAGAMLGALEGTRFARQDAQSHYLAAVAPNTLR